MRKKKITIEDIKLSLYHLDTEYGEALARALIELKYLSDSPLNLSCGTEKQKRELERVYNKPLSAEQINELISFISDKMKNDFQYPQYSKIADEYKQIVESMKRNNDIER